jgi:hypothetical protein
LSPYAITHNTILHNGTINGLALAHGESLVVRNHETTIHVTGTPAIDNDAVIRMMFDDSGIWGSTLSFDPGTLMTLAGTLELDLEAGVSLSSLAGQSFQLFDWTGVSHDGSFSIVGDPAWDISDLYLTGVVRLPPEFEMGMMARMGGPSPMTANLRIDGSVADRRQVSKATIPKTAAALRGCEFIKTMSLRPQSVGCVKRTNHNGQWRVSRTLQKITTSESGCALRSRGEGGVGGA